MNCSTKIKISSKRSVDTSKNFKVNKPSLPIVEDLNLHALTQENGQLRRSLEECESDLHEYIEKENKFSSSSAMFSDTPNRVSEIAASKIRELSKRVRDLTAEMEVYKSKYNAADVKLAAFIRENQDSDQHISNPRKEQSQVEEEKRVDQIQILTEKLNTTNAKLCECRNQCQQFRLDLKIAQKAIANEIGENVSLHSLTSGSSNWRGRAQQIISLQQKVSELQDRLKEQSGYESKRMTAMKQMEKERRAAQQHVEHELEETQAQLDECKKKFEGARIRNRILDAEMTNLKKRLSVLLEKSSHDDQFIATLNGQLSVQEKKWKEQEEAQQKSSKKLEQTCRSLQQDLAQEKSRTAELQTLLADRDSRMTQLERRLSENKEYQWNSHKITRSSSQESDGSLHSSSRMEKIPRSPIDQKLDQNQYQILGMAAEAERLRLIELLAVTNKRLEDQRKKAQDIQDRLMQQQKKCARLEVKIARLELERTVTNKSGNYRQMKHNERETSIPEEVTDKMELLEEQVCVLQAQLQNVKQERETDLKNYANLLDQIRKIFLSAQKENNQ